jgi:hypothetical protein
MSFTPGPNLTVERGAGQGPGGQYNHLSVGQDQNLYVGIDGGTLLLGPPGAAPGAMSLTDMQNRTWHLLREDGPDTGYAAPTTGDFNITVVTRDLNIAIAQWISQTGCAPSLTDRMDNFHVYPVLDYPVPPGLVSITRIEYTPAGEQTYKLVGQSFSEFDYTVGSVLPNTTGQPYYYRQPFGGYIRLQPQPSPGNAQGPGTGTISFTLAITGQTVTATLQQNATSTPVTTLPFVVQASDTLASVATKLAAAIAASPACVGITAFLAVPSTANNSVQLTALAAPGTSISYFATITGSGVVAPTAATTLAPSGDIITFYYSSLGTILINPLDVPGIPPQFHMAPVYRVLTDYWARKQDFNQSKHYMDMFDLEVKRGKAFVFDSNRATQETIAGSDYDSNWPEGGG